MIRPLLSAIFVLFASTVLLPQAPCAPTTYDVINANQVRAHVSNGGDLFNNSGNDPGFSAPYVAGTPERHTLFTTALTLAGIDPAGNLRLAQVGFRSDPGDTDYRPGPLDAATGEVIPGACQDFDRIWTTNRYDIQLLRADFADGTVDDPIPASLRQWPARGNPYFLDEFGFELPAQSLAPFYDENQDGGYDPADGDYPVLEADDPEAIPDEMLWTVFNDAAAPHEFGTNPLNVEVQLLVFAFNCADSELLNRTVFTRHRIINRSGVPFSGFRLGLFVDPDVGCFEDDHLGVDSTLSTVYFYNQDATDGNEACACTLGVNTYCQAPPAQTLTFLSQPMSSLIYHGFNGFIPLLPAALDAPMNPAEYYHLLSGRWRTGDPITRGGSGYNPGSTDTTLFVFHGPPDDQGWSMQNVGTMPVDYRVIPAFRLDQFLPNQILEFDMAHAYHQNPDVDYYGQVAAALERIPALQTLHDNGYATPCQQSALCTADCVWPGDANNSGIVEPFDGLAIGLAAGNDATGQERPLANNQWRPQSGEDWSGSGTDGVNHKHADANGDGTVNLLDGAVFDLNYSRQRPGATLPPDIPATDGDYELHLTHSRPELDAADLNQIRRSSRTTISIGTEEDPAEDIYGIAFSIRYDPLVMEESIFGFFDSQIPATFLGDYADLIYYRHARPEPGRIDAVVCRADGQNVSGYGTVTNFNLAIREDALTGNPDGTADIVYEVFNVRAVNAAGEELLVGARVDTIQAINLTYDPTLSTRDPLVPRQLRLFPNPTRGEFNVALPTGWRESFQLELFDATGRRVWSREERAAGPVLTTNLPEGLPEGLYFLNLRDAEGKTATGKVLVNR